MEKISKNFKKGKLITHPQEIIDLANKGKSVYVPVWKRNSPAAFLLSWQLKLVMEWINKKRFYTNEKIKS